MSIKRKRILPLLSLILLCSCGKQPAAPAQDAEAETVKTPEVPAQTEAPERSVPADSGTAEGRDAELPLCRKKQESMEQYEDMEVAFLGTTGPDRDVDAILKRAAAIDSLSFVSELQEDRVFYGDKGPGGYYVYLVVPGLNTDLKIGSWNWYAGEITDTAVEEKNALPVIYVESCESIDPLGKIEVVRHFPEGDAENWIYTGLGAESRTLRSDYHMGVVDISPYEIFDSSERPFYAQRFFDELLTYEEVSDAVKSGKELHRMEEMYRDGKMYSVYSIEFDAGTALYGVHYEPLSGEFEVISSYNSGETWNPLGRG